jgi:hypothetical protein
MNSEIWYKNIDILYKNDKLIEFFPTESQTLEERMNAIMRLSIYISVLLYFNYSQNSKYLLIIPFTALLTMYIYSNKEKVEGIEETGETKKEGDKCTRPTLDNPFMNATMKDYLNIEDGKIVDRPEACDIEDPQIKAETDKYFENNLYRDVGDVFGKMNSQREFYTMPSTTIPNDQESFSKWLYSTPYTCKENSDSCLRYEDLRYKSNQGVQFNPTENPVITKK